MLLETTLQNRKSGQEVAKIFRRYDRPGDHRPPANRQLSKMHKDYWKARLEKRSYTNDGERAEVNEWSIRIQHLGKRMGFALGTSNAEAAAVKARDIYKAIYGKGWAAAEAEFNPPMIVRRDDPTIGQFLQEVAAKSGLKAKTFRTYSGYFRRIVADIFGMGKTSDKFSYRNGKRTAWVEQVDQVRLAEVTPARIEDWRKRYIKTADNNPAKQGSVIRSCNSYLRCARALFSRKWIKKLDVRLPEVLPFHEIVIKKSRPPKYNSDINAAKLLQTARQDLAVQNPEAYKVFLLGFGAGLRKGEIDALECGHFNFDNGTVAVKPTEHHDVKTEGSEAEVQLDHLLTLELKRLAPVDSRFYIVAKGRPRQGLNRQYYRAESVFQSLYAWLAAQGVTAARPLHTLRKEFGSLINDRFGLFAAMTALRHTNITTTSDYYVDNKRRIALPVAELLATDPGPK
ncbi:MAG: tyrosine recombinase XerC [Limisphaerales bacterium]